ncbi:MAG: DUF692 family protein [Rhodocyclales bacterium]|nr:DUF692 family protein [Rhodocyclales bacterium]
MKAPELGVGLVYIPGLEPLFESRDGSVQVLELEPQALWRYFPDRPQPYANQAALLARLKALPQHKIVHGVGFPVGGARAPDPRHLSPFCEAIETIGAAWASEHLVFNQAKAADGRLRQTGFFLPPLATPAGVEAAANSIRAVADGVPVPFAVETPANYLKTIPGQMSDGAFTAAVVERADCGIVLDLHNIWTNEVNGRQSVEEFLSCIPLERVLEIHLAGGLKYGNFWLDAHSGDIPQPVLDWAHRLAPCLPNLGAIIYEVLPAYLPSFGLAGVRRAVEQMHAIWANRAAPDNAVRRFPAASDEILEPPSDLAAADWEDALAEAILSEEPPATPLGKLLAADPAVPLIRDLNRKFRMSAVVANLRMTIRLLLLELPPEEFDSLVLDYCAKFSPQRFGGAEARGFADYLQQLAFDIPFLDEILRYEVTAMEVIADGRPRVVPFSTDPEQLLDALATGRLPASPRRGTYEAEIVAPQESSFENPTTLH